MALRAIQVQARGVEPVTGGGGGDEDYDPIFFPKEAIKRGTRLTCYGRRDPLSEWVVTRIETYVKTPRNLFRLDQVDTVQKLSDVVYLQRQGPHDGSIPSRRSPTFGSLSYSAIWRLKR